MKVELGSGDTQSGFELTFDLPRGSPLSALFLITGGGGGVPLMRVVLIVTSTAAPSQSSTASRPMSRYSRGHGGVGKLVGEGQGSCRR